MSVWVFFLEFSNNKICHVYENGHNQLKLHIYMLYINHKMKKLILAMKYTSEVLYCYIQTQWGKFCGKQTRQNLQNFNVFRNPVNMKINYNSNAYILNWNMCKNDLKFGSFPLFSLF